MHMAPGDPDGVRQRTGSRNSNGNVPKSNWNDDKFQLNWYNSDNRNDNLRSREKFPHNAGSCRRYDR